MAQDKNAFRIETDRGAQLGNGAQGIIDGFFLHGDVANVCRHELGAVFLGPLFIAQNGDALGGQSPSQVAKRFVGADGLVAILWPGAVDEHHRPPGAAASGRQCQRARQPPLPATDREPLFAKSIGPGVGRRTAGLGSGVARDKEQAGDLPFGVKHHFRIQRRPLELAGYQHHVIPGHLGRPGPKLFLERTGLRLEGLPGFPQLWFG